MASFKTLRLVTKNVKADAHRAWPAGIARLANKGTERLLYPDPDLPPPDFQQGLRELSLVLAEIKSLSSTCERFNEYGERRGCKEHLEWFDGVVQVLRTTRLLESLTLDFQEAGARFDLRRLPLRHLRLRSLCLHGVETGYVKRLDPSWMDTLESLSVIGVVWDDMNGSMGRFRLPRQLRFLNLSTMRISSDLLDALNLDTQDDLRHLQLRHSSLSRALPPLPALRELVLDHSHLSDDLALETFAPWGQLEKVSLVAVEPFSSAAPLRLGANHSIRKLDMRGTNIRDVASFQLANNASLQILDLSRCQLESLAFGLPRNGTLKELSLEACTITVPLMHQLVGELAGNSTLAKLDLGRCGLTDEVMLQFKLEKTSGLEELELGGNRNLTERGLKPLADSIVEHKPLRKLGLNHCSKLAESFVNELRTASRIVE